MDVIEHCHAAAAAAKEGLPMTGKASDEVNWVVAHLHEPCPAFDMAPSQAAIGLWLTVDADGSGALTRELMRIRWRSRLPCGDWAAKEPTGRDRAQSEREREAYQAMFGDLEPDPEADRGAQWT